MNPKTIFNFLIALTVFLWGVMCAVVAANYVNLWWGGRYAGWSAPTWVAFLYAIPFAIAIGVCLLLAGYFRTKA